MNQSANRIVQGDNLEVLKLLQKSYLGKIKMIYIDPPFTTGADFSFTTQQRHTSHFFEIESDRVVGPAECAGS